MSLGYLQELTPRIGFVTLRSWMAWLRNLFIHERVLILRKTFAHPPAPENYQVVEHVSVRPEVIRLYLGFGRGLSLSEDRLERRFAHGLRFFELREGDESRATTWAVPPGGERFVDELGLGFPIREGMLWLRDIFVAEDARSHGVFAALLDGVVAVHFPDTCTLWSAVDPGNGPSVRAHARYGHEVVGRYEVFQVLRRLIFRRRWPQGPWDGSCFAFDRRLLVVSEAYRRFIHERLA